MKQERHAEITKKAIELPIKFTKILLEITEKVRMPSKKVDKIGRTVGTCIGIGLILTGGVQLFLGRLPCAIGTASVGGITIVSNLINVCINRQKNIIPK